MAINRPFDPDSCDTLTLMTATDTDPAYKKLCTVQNSFRARLTPKPWRCHCAPLDVSYPRDSDETRRAFATWQAEYGKSAGDYATCHYLETVGVARAASFANKSIELHDRVTRSETALPLA